MQQRPEPPPAPPCVRTPQAAGSWPEAAGRAERRQLWDRIQAAGLDRAAAEALWRALGLPAQARLCVALSGGADSVLLLHLAAARGARVDAVHVRHRLRGRESQEDAAFCRRLCRSLGVPLLAPRAELAGGPGLELRAREARRAALRRCLARLERAPGSAAPPGWLALGHQAQDRGETVLWRWMRGHDLASLALDPPDGAPQLAGWRVIRPLADLSRGEVRALAGALGLAWREDRSNSEEGPARNRLRLRLWPALEAQAGSGAGLALERLSQAALEFERALARRLPQLAFEPAAWSAAVAGQEPARVLAREPLGTLPAFARQRLLRGLLLGPLRREPGQAHLQRLCAALARPGCFELELPGGWLLGLDQRRLYLLPPHQALPEEERSWDLAGPLVLGPGRELAPEAARLPGEPPGPRAPLLWRRAELGLRVPIAAGRRVLLGDLARSAGIPVPARRRLLLLLDERGPRAVPGLWNRAAASAGSRARAESGPRSGDRATPSG